MDCDRIRDAISAGADGEEPGVAQDVIDAHLERCAACRAFQHSAHDVRRQVAMYDASSVPDLSRDIVKRVAQADRRRSAPIIRWLLALVAVQIVVLSIPDFLADEPDSHSLRHLGAFSLAYAVGLLVVVARPARARTMLNVAIVLVAALAATAVFDVVQGTVPLLSETVHLLEVASAVFLWVLARPGRPDDPGRPDADLASGRTGGLRVVPDDDR